MVSDGYSLSNSIKNLMQDTLQKVLGTKQSIGPDRLHHTPNLSNKNIPVRWN